MGQKYDRIMAAMQAEIEGDGKPAENTSGTPEQTADTQDDTTGTDDGGTPPPSSTEPPAGAGDDDDGGTPGPSQEKDGDGARPEGAPGNEPGKHGDGKRDIPDDPVKRAEFAFRRQLNKQKEKHDAELKDRDAKYDTLLKEFEELKKRIPEPQKEKLTRDKFGDDEDFIHALNREDFEKFKSEWEADARKKAEEREQEEKKRQEAERELKESQEAWLHNVDEAFGSDKERSGKFLSKIQYANEHGLGQILDNCPVASDYLMNDPMGPVVFEKLLDDRASFERVFDMRRLTPMNIFYQLKRIEEEITSKPAQPAPAPAKPSMPHLGKPGRQAAGSSMTNNDMFSDPKAIKKWLREHR